LWSSSNGRRRTRLYATNNGRIALLLWTFRAAAIMLLVEALLWILFLAGT
jgi:hypothetical protein